MGKLYCITSLFNPVGYRSRIRNYKIFADGLARQNIDLYTVELAFNDDAFQLSGDRVFQLHTNSVLWQKERMLNYAIERLPDDCEYVAWADCDLLFTDGWGAQAVDLLQDADVVQLYKTVHFLPPNVEDSSMPSLADSSHDLGFGTAGHGIVAQKKHHPDWHQLRKQRMLPYAELGFAWAAKRALFEHTQLYDKLILGSGDALFADACLDTLGAHPYWGSSPRKLQTDMLSWAKRIGGRALRCDYLDQGIFHLFHGARQDRGYRTRQQILLDHDFDPEHDVALVNGVYEWSSDKPGLHAAVRAYFHQRREDFALANTI